MKKILLLLALLISSIHFMHAQWPGAGGGKKQGPTIKGRITGKLIDTLSKAPVEFATVVLIDPAQEKEVDGVITDEKGVFKLQDVKNGKYNLTVSFLGYETKTIKNIELTLEKPDVNLDIVHLTSESVNLQEIEVTGEASLIENKIDKIVYNAEKDVTSAGGDATEVLRKVPLLSVDLDGNVSLRGNSNLRILINGRPSSLFSDNLADALKTLPADQIKNVEVITTPTAKYDGEGSAGIINIITKKKGVEGFTGSVSSSIGTRQNNAVLSLSAAKGRFGLNLNGSTFFSWKREGSLSFFREDQFNDATATLSQNGPNSSQVIGFNGTIGAFYDINAYNAISTSFRTNGFGNNRDGVIDASYINPALAINQLYTRYTDNRSLRSGFDWNTDYRKTYKNPEQELVFALQLSGNISDITNEIAQSGNDENLFLDETNNNDGWNLETTLQVDYVHPFSKKVKLETGAKGVIRNIDSDYQYNQLNTSTGLYELDLLRSDQFFYDQDVYSGYASFNLKLGEKWGLVAGARYEFTDIGGEYDSELPGFVNDYGNILPSFIISRTLKNFQTVKFSYSKRIQRPSLFFINPFVDLSDPRNITVGNPLLLPEIVNQYEVNYNTFIKGVVLNGSVFYRNTVDIIESFLQIANDGVSQTTFQNIGRNNSIGFNFFGSATLFKIWQVRLGFNIFTYNAESTVAGLNLSNEAVLYNGNAGSTISLKKDWKVELFGFYNSPRQTLQGTNPSFSIFSIGARKEFANKRASLGIRIVEPFFENKSFGSELRGANFYQEFAFVIPFRSFGLNFSYRFGKLDFKQRQRRSRIKNDDVKEGGDSNF